MPDVEGEIETMLIESVPANSVILLKADTQVTLLGMNVSGGLKIRSEITLEAGEVLITDVVPILGSGHGEELLIQGWQQQFFPLDGDTKLPIFRVPSDELLADMQVVFQGSIEVDRIKNGFLPATVKRDSMSSYSVQVMRYDPFVDQYREISLGLPAEDVDAWLAECETR